MPYAIPHVFKAGEKAIAEQVNTNFNYLKQSLEQLNTTLSAQISDTQNTLSKEIDTIQTQSNSISELIGSRDAILRLGTIVTPDPTEDGQIPTADINLSADKIHTATILANAQIIFPTLDDDEIFTNILFEFTINSTSSLTLPLNVKWTIGEIPEIVTDGTTINRLVFDTTNGGESWYGYHSYLNTVS